MKYTLVEWPDIQYYMDKPGFKEEVGFDPDKNKWFIPEDWEYKLFTEWDDNLDV